MKFNEMLIQILQDPKKKYLDEFNNLWQIQNRILYKTNKEDHIQVRVDIQEYIFTYIEFKEYIQEHDFDWALKQMKNGHVVKTVDGELIYKMIDNEIYTYNNSEGWVISQNKYNQFVVMKFTMFGTNN